MDLQKTVSEILNRQVSIHEAKNFANDQFGVLATYIRENNLNNKSEYFILEENGLFACCREAYVKKFFWSKTKTKDYNVLIRDVNAFPYPKHAVFSNINDARKWLNSYLKGPTIHEL